MPGEPAPDATAPAEPQRPLTPVLEDAPVGRVRRFVGRLVRWVTWLVVVGGVGVGLYYAWPMVRDRVVRPVEANTVQVAELTQRVESIEERLAGLEAQVAAVGADLETVRAAEADTAGEVGAQGTRVEGFDRRLRTLERTTDELQAAVDEVGSGFAQELAVLRAMELMSRARLFLYQANYGQAEQDLRAAGAVLAGQAGEPRIDQALTRIDMALSALPGRPVAAADDLDIAWGLLLGDVALSPPPAVASTTTPTTSGP